MSRFLILFLAGSALVGCASKSVSIQDSAVVPASRTFSADLFAAQAGTGPVAIRRDTGMRFGTCPIRVFVDAKPAADINTAEKMQLHLADGNHVLSISLAPPCSGNVLAETSAPVKAGSALSFKIAYSAAGEFSISPTAF